MNSLSAIMESRHERAGPAVGGHPACAADCALVTCPQEALTDALVMIVQLESMVAILKKENEDLREMLTHAFGLIREISELVHTRPFL